ncbi:hypothetical protein BCR34DRAFT_572249 [Clohesyomyces aquaticus]|uniref:Uncharacterized protein n=1 Tax=Clohesyomyces aquaticus TaxID=1231657 RepID=A0A1Y1Z4Z9_9PLEO|nr:hypothetical protein BCR34DRAFT_572249 [Clohesyomyces aquaticus]
MRNKRIDLLVLDADGDEWMCRWRRLSETFAIDHLRSPMFLHVDPAERGGLLGFAHKTAREHELVSLTDCIGKEVSKHRCQKK